MEPEENNQNIGIEENDNHNMLTKTFLWMFIGLLVTAGTAWYTYASGLFINIIVGGYFEVLLIAELIVVILFSLLFKKLPPMVVMILYLGYAILNGVSMAIIFVVFELSSIVYAFLGSAALFGGLALYGYKTKKDLSNWRTILFATLIVGIVVSLINLFMKNTMLDIILDWVILFVFFGITIYDMNKIKRLQEEESIKDIDKIYIYGAMQLYLDFINIFLRILSIFGKRRR